MGHILFGIFILCILMYYPEVFLLAGLILGGFYLHSKYDLVERDSKVADEADDEPTREEKAEKEAESKTIPGFRDDPEWKAASKKVTDRGAWMREISDLEMIIEDLEKEMTEDPNPGATIDLAEARKRLKTLENRAGLTQRRQERAKEEKIVPEIPQATPKDMTEQEIDAALQQLNDL